MTHYSPPTLVMRTSSSGSNSSSSSAFHSLVWKSFTGVNIYESKDENYNLILPMCKQGLFSNIRYTILFDITFFSLLDVIECFGQHMDTSANDNTTDLYFHWNNTIHPNDRHTLLKNAKTHIFLGPNEVETLVICRMDVFKLIAILPLPFEITSNNLELFDRGHKIHFGLIEKYDHTCVLNKNDRCWNCLIVFALLAGLAIGVFLTWYGQVCRIVGNK
jgi:hypothetical protein